ncbi:MAG: acetoacetate metabolism regulatory protein AtoC [Candidatus Binatia bacterium]|nr:MAG: acetoacetate metabolism regulatory protein AtoC [Candidatus Binatia bacterium]
MKARILVVDDDPLICEQVVSFCTEAGYEAAAAYAPEPAKELVSRERFDLAVVDLKLPGMDGVALMRELRSRAPWMDIVMITGHGSIRGAVEAIRQGASDYVTKPFEKEEILLAAERVLERRRLEDEVQFLRRQLEEHSFANMVSRNRAMLEIFATVRLLADSDLTVLVTGESGTGKELVARALHYQGKRRGGRFVAVNCAALPEQLMESELFGYERGAFTGATGERVGKIEWASGGTLFLDEVESMPLSMQAKLLRVLEERAVERLGGNRRIPVDMRVVAASNRDLESAVRAGQMREDFYYRINVVPVRIPPLRERPEDIPLLAANFLNHHPFAKEKGIRHVSDRALAKMLRYSWPGNVRELFNVLERALLRARGNAIEDVDLPEDRDDGPPAALANDGNFALPLRAYLRDAERRYLEHLLEKFGGAVSRGARHAAVDQATLHRKLKAHGLRPSEYRGKNKSKASA